MIGLILDHLWQSTLFAGVAGLLILTLRSNSAHIRHTLWFAASVKFLIPFAALTALGNAVLTPVAPPVSAPSLYVLRPMAQPFSAHTLMLSETTAAAPDLTQYISPLLLALWAVGFAAIAARWLMRWVRLRNVLRAAIDCPIAAPVRVKTAPSMLEPGLVGILRPVILLPQGIAERLSDAEMQAVLAHELCHLRRRDNLLAATHMLVEALFWFHPLVWWLGARLNTEREHACDESVLAAGQTPQIYAESILKVCRFYLHSPLDCAAGISGADLKRRIETIIESNFSIRLNIAKKMLLAGSAALAIAAPLAIGLLATPLAQAAAGHTTPHPGTEAALRHQIEAWEQRSPAIEALDPDMVAVIAQNRFAIQKNFEEWGALKSIAFKGVDEHNWDVYDAQFERASTTWSIASLMPDGKISGMNFSQNFKRADTGPSPGVPEALRRLLDGQNPADILTPRMAQTMRLNIWRIETDTKALGPVQSVTFQKVDPRGLDQYEAIYAHGRAIWHAAPLANGKLDNIYLGEMRVDVPAHPGTEAAIRRYIDMMQKGRPDYSQMVPAMAEVQKQQLPNIIAALGKLGALKSLTFQGGAAGGMDSYEAVFENGKATFMFAPLSPDGKMVAMGVSVT